MASEAQSLELSRQVDSLGVRWANALTKFVRHKPLGAIGAAIILVMLILTVISSVGLADELTGYRYDEQVLRDRLSAPSSTHLLGTDHLGRDQLSRVVHGSKISISIGFFAVSVSTILAVAIGMPSGYFGGRADTVIQRVVDVWMAMPGLVMLIFLIAIFGRSLFVMVVVLGTLQAARVSRLVRGTTLGVANEQYVDAARSLGATNVRIMMLHVLPNIFHIVLISISVSIGGAILVESTLSFLGLGLPPPYPTWGRMLSDSRAFLAYPILGIIPGVAITITVFAFNVLGDALRDVLDPRLRGTR